MGWIQGFWAGARELRYHIPLEPSLPRASHRRAVARRSWRCAGSVSTYSPKRWRVAETYSSGEFGPPKTRSSRRSIPMSTTLVGIFKRLRPAGCGPETLVFHTPKGTPLNPQNLYNRELAPACDAIGQARMDPTRREGKLRKDR